MIRIPNFLSVLISRRRWSKRLFGKLLPSISSQKILGDNVRFFFDPRDMRGPSFHFAYDLENGFNNYEFDSKEHLVKSIPDGGVFFDIGANIGLFSIYIANKRSDVSFYCFEPETHAHQCLSETSKTLRNTKINIFNYAVGELESTLPLFKSSKNDGGHSLVHDWSEKNVEKDSDYVEVINLDNFIEKENIPAPDVVKIDVEGYELNVLKGMINIIKKFKPVLLIETNNEDVVRELDFWQYITTLPDMKVYFSIPGKDEHLPINELKKEAAGNIRKNKKLSNYIYYFK